MFLISFWETIIKFWIAQAKEEWVEFTYNSLFLGQFKIKHYVSLHWGSHSKLAYGFPPNANILRLTVLLVSYNVSHVVQIIQVYNFLYYCRACNEYWTAQDITCSDIYQKQQMTWQYCYKILHFGLDTSLDTWIKLGEQQKCSEDVYPVNIVPTTT